VREREREREKESEERRESMQFCECVRVCVRERERGSLSVLTVYLKPKIACLKVRELVQEIKRAREKRV